jgi:two-component system, cell cycle sensor histidine kinase and response regulator CckA
MSSKVFMEVQHSKTATTPLRVLILEDSNEDVDLIVCELNHAGFEVIPTTLRNRNELRQAIAEKDFDAVLADYLLPGWCGLDAIAELRAADKDVPVLMVTGAVGDEVAVECIKQGASDYVLKGHIGRLPIALKRALNEKALRDENAKAQEALRASEARNRELVENAVYGVARVGGDGTLLDANPAFLRILDGSRENELGNLSLARDLFRFPEDCARLMAKCREDDHVDNTEVEWRRRDGGIVTVRIHLRRASATDQPEVFEMTVEDVTELRAIERQLQQAQKFEAVGEMAAGVAHDFNNVVGAILGWAELGFEQSRDNPAVAERFGRIREQAERAATLTRELLAFARRQVLQPRAIDLNGVASGLVGLLDRVIGKDIELKFRSSPLDPVKADVTQIEQVLMNLCLNARDAMPDGGRLVVETEMAELDEAYCRFYPYVTPGRYAVVSVSDTGIGMDAQTRERIFEPFFTTKGKGKGTGIGLATVYGIVRQHSGFLHVYSEPGHGSLFRVYLPAISETNTERSMSAKTCNGSHAGVRGTETILLADDHESIREMSRQTLTALGYRVLSACDGEEALRLCEHETPALAILDVVMPKLGGPATAARLAERFGQMRVLFTSGYSARSQNAPEEGATRRYLQKPYSPTTLAHLVRQILDEKRVEPAP